MLAEEREELLNKIFILETKLSEIRTSRRTLFHLLEKLEKDRRQELFHLEAENKRLKLKNNHLIHSLYKNGRKNYLRKVD